MNPLPRYQIIPEVCHQVSLQCAGREYLRWHYGANYPRPFFFPFLGPSGVGLTRLGHPGAPDHDHHRSIWFAHAKVLGIDFWKDQTSAQVRQKQWLAYRDGDAEGIMAVLLGWFDGHDPKALIEQELVAGFRVAAGELALELQATFRPTAASLELQKTNFGFLAVRVAKSLSAAYGGGQLTGADGKTHEKNLFGKPNRWMDYSGPVGAGQIEGITCFDHPTNPMHPTHWHVRDDGWMGAAACFAGAVVLTHEKPLRLRYLLRAHAGAMDAKMAGQQFADFAKRPPFVVTRNPRGHGHWEVSRADGTMSPNR